MIRQFLVILILYLLLNQIIEYYNDSNKENIKSNPESEVESEPRDESENVEESEKKNKQNPKSKEKPISINLFGKPHDYKPNEYILWLFTQPSPWSQIIYAYKQDFPFKFFIKVKIPSLNDYESWKEVIPNLDFDARTGELIIPSKNEASALAVTNLILSTFKGQLKLETILEKGLIQISIMKAQQYELVKNKLKEQIMDTLQGKSKTDLQTPSNNDYEADLARSNIKESNNDNFEEFTNEEPIAAMEADGYSYI
jgi:hypothetical protein